MNLSSLLLALFCFFCHFSKALAIDVTPEENASIQDITKRNNWSFMGKREINGIPYYKFSSSSLGAKPRYLIISKVNNLAVLAKLIEKKGPAVIELPPTGKAYAGRYFFDIYERKSAELMTQLNTGLTLEQILVPDTGVPIFHFKDKFGHHVRLVHPSRYIARAQEHGEVRIVGSNITFTKETEKERDQLILENLSRLGLEMTKLAVGAEKLILLTHKASGFRALIENPVQLSDTVFLGRVEQALLDFQRPASKRADANLLSQIAAHTQQIRFYGLALSAKETNWVFTNPNQELVFVDNLNELLAEIKILPPDTHAAESCFWVFAK